MKEKILKNLLLNHNNDYGFDVLDILVNKNHSTLPNLSIIIPYYNTGSLIKKVIHHITNAIALIESSYPNWKYEIIIIDDGSTEKPLSKYVTENALNLKCILNDKNEGRSFTRQRGLQYASYEVCLFMDSDILIDKTQIISHLKLHATSPNTSKSNFITVSFFEFGDNKHHLLKYDQIAPNDLKLNDYRLHCLYGPTWIGCEEDKAFIGMEFDIVYKTNYFRNWKGMYYAWAISNMILGGFFMVNRQDCLDVGGFNLTFQGYGFTETSLATKLIAIKNNYVVPVVIGGGLHVEDSKINHSRTEKDDIFWKKHDFYFNKYLYLTTSEVINDVRS